MLGPRICGRFELKTVLLVVIALGVIISIYGIITGGLAAGLISLLVDLYGIYGIWYELALHVKIFGIIKLIAFIIVNVLDIISFRNGVAMNVLIFLVVNDILDLLLLYGIWLFYRHVSGRFF
ncbi:hypothetical protein HK103_006066 [Boothiomyces macroporosus]|uniref:Uncharacterized protein n=1 Tax=Boothiomyces macroporosus TaxID=261099 RepID=A0AAD5UER5_9FUNG|nr:hypothetical protein HK103_006066 [Boothiomyces macroporosus]